MILCLQFTQAQSDITDSDQLSLSEHQFNAIEGLLKTTKLELSTKLQSIKNNEEYSKAIIKDSYSFAKSLSKIMEFRNMPFDLMVNSTAFMGCWAEGGFKNNACVDDLYASIHSTQLAKSN